LARFVLARFVLARFVQIGAVCDTAPSSSSP